MKPFITGLLLGLFVVVMIWAFPSQSATLDPLIEYRYINPAAGETVKRLANGDIDRSDSVLQAYQLIHPCPKTGLTTGKCLGWALNHNAPLACGSRDAVFNISWIKFEFKTGYALIPDPTKKSGYRSSPMGYINELGVFVSMQRYAPDRVERKINALNPPIPDTANCVNEVVP